MSWGTELWDKYHDLVHHSLNGIDFLEHSVANFVKERGKLEADYAKNLRSLVKKYSPKEMVRPKQEEYSHMRAYKQMLTEVGYEAGQHEILAESYTKEQYKSVHESVKQLKESRKKNIKEHESITNELRKAFKCMEVSKEKFRKAFDDMEKAAATYKRANDDGSVSRNEVNKLQMQSAKTGQACENAKGKYASQLVKTNEFQSGFYQVLLPRVLENLQQMEQQRINIIKHALLKVVTKEKEVQPIIDKCLTSMEVAIQSVDAIADTEAAIERYKSGDVPPGDFKFEDIQDPKAMLNHDPIGGPTNLNLYPEKKKLEKAIREAEAELEKKQRELKSLEQMVSTYKKNPKFGNTKHFAGEIENLCKDITELEAALAALRSNKTNVEERLEALRSKSPMVVKRNSNSRNGSSPTFVRDQTPRSSQSSGSLKSLSIGSSGGVAGHSMNTSPADSGCIYDVPESSSVSHLDPDDNWDDHEFNPPPPPPPQPGSGSNIICVAMYPYPCQGEELQDSNIPMMEGEEFDVVEEDSDGWTRVRRKSNGEEGYVPTSFIRLIR